MLRNMRRIGFIWLLMAFLATISPKAYAESAVYYTLKDDAGVTISAYPISSGATITTQSISTRDNVGYQAVLIKVNSGSVTVTQQVSMDNLNWYTPNTTDGASLSDVSGVVSGLSSTAWIIVTARLANYIRFLVNDASGTGSNIDFQYIYLNKVQI